MKTYQERARALLRGVPVALPLLLAALPAAAQNPLLPGIGATDRRVVVDATRAPWTSLVRVQSNLGARCTGVLVAPRRVVTAAHCLLNRVQRFLPASSLHVLFGYDRGEYREHRAVAALETGGPYDRERRLGGLVGDWAVLTLDGDAPDGAAPLPLARVPPEPGTPLMLGGYSQDKAHIVTADTGCAARGINATDRGPLLIHDCDGTRGVSGAALLVRMSGGGNGGTGEGWAVAGIAVAAVAGPDPRNIAVPAAAFVAAVEGNTPSLR
ncbi:trypsin-like serine peptidase [Azospirillum isscasi]|uniref:Serine protease n=1 Tax=Azospirillum isscasi TaxID=3053926 RepID=A0ABU0WMG4_9PROT|nr:trypsin-like peptidase domain-containing protein [Azospirillum isscasi]MDQ2105417.1 trypsin-like peptidase domain-containing protein [Azospirillum isscasi]